MALKRVCRSAGPLLLPMAALCWIASAAPARAQSAAQSAAATTSMLTCSQLPWLDFSSVEDAPATITDSRVISDAKVPYCQVDGVVSEKTRFTARFPLANWNGKIVVVGTGGQAGTIVDEDRYVRLGGRPGLIASGYAFLAHDAGHVGAKSGIDTLWGLNNRQAMIDYGFRSAHATAIIGKEILRRFYKRPVAKTYYQTREKHLKSESSRRLVPVHRRLVDVGLLRLVAQRRDAAEQRIFPELVRDRFERLSANASRRCNRVIDRVSTDPRLCFHSFRHFFKTHCRSARLQDSTNDQLTGHAPPSIGRRYGEGVDLGVLGEEVDRLDFEFIDWEPILRAVAIAAPVPAPPRFHTRSAQSSKAGTVHQLAFAWQGARRRTA